MNETTKGDVLLRQKWCIHEVLEGNIGNVPSLNCPANKIVYIFFHQQSKNTPRLTLEGARYEKCDLRDKI